MKSAFQIGIKPHEYYDMTPHELNLCFEVFAGVEEAKSRERAFLAYVNAKLPRFKKFPTFEKAFGYKEIEVEKKPQTAADMLAEIVKLNAALGGEVS